MMVLFVELFELWGVEKKPPKDSSYILAQEKTVLLLRGISWMQGYVMEVQSMSMNIGDINIDYLYFHFIDKKESDMTKLQSDRLGMQWIVEVLKDCSINEFDQLVSELPDKHGECLR